MKPIIMSGGDEISDTGMVPRGLRIFSLAAGCVPAELRTIPATEVKAQSNGAGSGHRPAVDPAAGGASQERNAMPVLANDPLAGMTAKQIFFDCVWLSEESTATKIMLLCIGRFFDDNARSSSMSYAQVARECGLHEVTTKKIANAVRDRWLRIGVGKGFYVPGKGAQNLYHGVCPPGLVERLREERRKGRVVPRDAEIEKAASTAADRVKSGVASDCTGVASDYPEGDRGSLRFGRGLPQATRTQIDTDKDKDSGASAPGAGATKNLFSGAAPDQGDDPPHVAPTSTRGTGCKPSSAEPKPKRAAPRLKATDEQFARFWAAYPIREGKAAALRNFLKLTHDEAELAVVGAAGYAAKIAKERERLARRGEEPRIKWAQGWLTERRFEDYATVDKAAAGGASDDPEAEVERMLAGPDGQRLVRDKGPDEARRIISDIVNGKGAPHA
jgi:hypothetical protein